MGSTPIANAKADTASIAAARPSLVGMSFERPVADVAKLLAAWQEWESGEQAPGRVLADLKKAGLADVLKQLVETGWVPSATA